MLVAAQAAACWSHNTAVVLLTVALNGGVLATWARQRWFGQQTSLPGLAQPGFLRSWLAVQALDESSNCPG